MHKKILIVGGTSGLGSILAKKYRDLGHTVFVTGRNDAGDDSSYIPFAIHASSKELRHSIDEVVARVREVNTLIYCAGFYQEGSIDTLTDENIIEQINVGLTAPALLVQRLKNNPGKPLKVMLVTSSSQYTPREKEPVYSAVKAGLGMFGSSLGLDTDIGKVLVVAPSGMNTPFWKKEKDVSHYLDPEWVADRVIELSSGPFKYRYAKILRDPARVEIVETKTT